MIERIHERAVFRGFGRAAPRSSSGPLTLVRNDSVHPDVTAVAYAIPRAVGSAVVRNRLRRQLRVAMADLAEAGLVGSAAYLVVVRPGARGADMSDLRGWLEGAAARLPAPTALDSSDISSTDLIGQPDRFER